MAKKEKVQKLYKLKIKCYHCGTKREMMVGADELDDFGINPDCFGNYSKDTYSRVSRIPCSRCITEGVRVRGCYAR